MTAAWVSAACALFGVLAVIAAALFRLLQWADWMNWRLWRIEGRLRLDHPDMHGRPPRATREQRRSS